ncbi:MAG TPA: PIG-L deacetylase family protein [Planctomycetota bacterium]|nr:PIG-L deacetylase family protein [Planctomycetota bacterium]
MPKVLAVMAHPDDIEITCAGTLALLKQAGWGVHLATMTAGDLGSMTRSRPEISEVRKGEAARSAEILGAGYTCLGFDDLTVIYDAASKRRVCGLLREVRPDMVITHSADDYMSDHTETPKIVREAAFASTIPNWEAALNGKKLPPSECIPAILYADPIENVDARGRRVPARFVVDITSTMAEKERMLACHASQREWLREQHGEDEYLLSMKRWGADRARDFRKKTVKYAEGFTQHLGHGFPKDDLLTKALGKKRVKTIAGSWKLEA